MGRVKAEYPLWKCHRTEAKAGSAKSALPGVSAVLTEETKAEISEQISQATTLADVWGLTGLVGNPDSEESVAFDTSTEPIIDSDGTEEYLKDPDFSSMVNAYWTWPLSPDNRGVYVT
ncbi:hypothetical protein F441_01851 [Phytophthora nicotianae CJ01A1]|uniref:Uncharacterized protein n=3 Tax=Phytophthora nicotianae TaxID=4792 RepID=W3A1A5_PHYNI|nr:hypothetical protein L915_01815 [Phytophthora nicotianae]ETP25270.1 hypothetical protein F441_01851 [Phytophthora nicotianae CJ01A1]ETP53318.1 hypothetical protein F442_01828 [Phytophthora nicotianae P10297]